MAATTWEGRLVAITQVDTITIADTWAAADTVTVTIGGKAVILTVGTTATVTAVATAVKEMVNGTAQSQAAYSVDGTFDVVDITATSAVGVVTVTANTAGVPFTMTATETTTGDGTATREASVANQSPNDANDSGNWSNGVPTDIVIIKDTSSSLKWNLGALTAVTITSYTQDSTFTGEIGLPPERATASGTFAEPEEQYLLFAGITTAKIGEGSGTGSSRTKISIAAVTSNFYVYSSAARSDGVPSILLKTGAGTNALYNYGGSVGVAALAGEAATIATITQSGSGSELVVGAGALSLTTLNVSAGTVDCRIGYTTANISGGTVTVNGVGAPATTSISAGTVTLNSTGTAGTVNLGGGTFVHNGIILTNFHQTGGTATLNGTGTIVAMNAEGGTCYLNGRNAASNAITTLVLSDATLYWNGGTPIATASIYKDGIFDLRNDAGTKVITNQLQLYPGAYVYAPAGNLTLTGGFKLNGCDFNDLGALQLGDGRACTAFA